MSFLYRIKNFPGNLLNSFQRHFYTIFYYLWNFISWILQIFLYKASFVVEINIFEIMIHFLSSLLHAFYIHLSLHLKRCNSTENDLISTSAFPFSTICFQASRQKYVHKQHLDCNNVTVRTCCPYENLSKFSLRACQLSQIISFFEKLFDVLSVVAWFLPVYVTMLLELIPSLGVQNLIAHLWIFLLRTFLRDVINVAIY